MSLRIHTNGVFVRLRMCLDFGFAIQVPLCGDGACKQFFEITAFESFSLYYDMIDFAHDFLY